MSAPPPITFSSQLTDASGNQQLTFAAMDASAGLSVLEEIHLKLSSTHADLAAQDILGTPAHVAVVLNGGGGTRYFQGFVTSFGMAAPQGSQFGYAAVLRPWLWLLTRRTDCRVFQNKTVVEVVSEVFSRYSFANYFFNLYDMAQYPTMEYCVQYKETDFDFVSRLLEQEGIYWYFEHTQDSHRLMLVNSLSAHEGSHSYAYFAPNEISPANEEVVTGWQFSKNVVTTDVAVGDFNLINARSILLGQGNSDLATTFHTTAGLLEDFQYPSMFDASDPGTNVPAYANHYAERFLEEVQTAYNPARGQTNGRSMALGHVFELKRHPRADQNTKYLITATATHAELLSLTQPTPGDGGTSYSCKFEVIPASQQFRPARRTLKPLMSGPQTAIVTGDAGQEIHSDEFGRIKVKFHWNRTGPSDAGSSCWVPVAQIWAGNRFGVVFTPRVGHEVIVDFIEGDPDRPIVTGSVYHQLNKPGFLGDSGQKLLESNSTLSGIQTCSTPGGSGEGNTLRFNDAKGNEEIYLRAQKNQVIHVLNNENTTVDGNRDEYVKGDETIKIDGKRDETVGKDEVIHVKGNRAVNIDGNDQITIGGNRTKLVSGNEEETIKGNQVGIISGNRTTKISGDETGTISGVWNTTADGAVKLESKTSFTIKAPDTGGVLAKKLFKTSDSDISGTGAKIALQGFNFGLTGINVGLTGVTMAATGVSLAAVGVAVTATGVKVDHAKLKIDHALTSVAKKVVEIKWDDFFVAKAELTVLP